MARRLLSAWIEAMRLRTLPVSIAGVVAAAGLAAANGVFVPWVAADCLVFAILCQIASNFANEYFDYKAGRDRAGREGPRRGVTEGDIIPGDMLKAVIGTLFVAALCGMALAWHAGWWLIVAGALIGVGALAYSTGPFPLSTHCLGEVAVIFFFGIIPVNLTYYVQALAWNWQVFTSSVAIGLMGANVLLVNNIRDIPDDKAVGKHTLATTFGSKVCAAIYMANALIAIALTAWIWPENLALAIPAIYAGLSASICWQLTQKFGAALTPFLGMTAVAMLAYAIAATIVLIQ